MSRLKKTLRWPFRLGALMAICFCHQRLSAQDSVQSSRLSTAFRQYVVQHLPEKCFVQTDRISYVAGETIRLKIYAVDGFYNKPLDLSKVVYTELLDPENNPVVQGKMAMQEGSASGSMEIPDTLTGGSYRLRTYTNWMKNAGPEYFFEKTIRVYNSSAVTQAGSGDESQEPMHFFPEGGKLVAGLVNSVVFGIAGSSKPGVGGRAVLMNGEADSLQTLPLSYTAPGRFSFTPKTGEHYKVLIRSTTGNQSFDLPAVESDGIILHLEKNDSGAIDVFVRSTAVSPPEGLWLFLQAHGVPKHCVKIVFQQGGAHVRFLPDQLGQGVHQITLLEANGTPLCQRLFFVQPRHLMKIGVGCDPVFAARKPVRLSLHSTGENGEPLPAILSVSVSLADHDTSAGPVSIDRYFWLNSELPGSFSDNPGDSSWQAIDNYLITKHSDRFPWKDIFTAATPGFPPETKDHIITGKIVDSLTGKSAPFVYLYASVVGKETKFRSAESDSSGRFRLEMPGFTNNDALVVQTSSEDSRYRVELSDPFSDRYADPHSGTMIPDSSGRRDLGNRLFNAQIENTFPGDSIQPMDASAGKREVFYGHPDYRYHLDDYTRFTTMEEVMREYVKTVNVFRSGGKLRLVLLNLPADHFFTDPPLVLMDGVPVFDPSGPMNLDPLKISDIELVNREYLLGPQKFSGIINCLSYHGDLGGYTLPPQAQTLNYEGLRPERRFTSPAYPTQASRENRIPDYRTLLYWAPSIETGAGGEKQIQFFTSDIPGRYAVVVNGLTADGLAGSQTIYFTVSDTRGN